MFAHDSPFIPVSHTHVIHISILFDSNHSSTFDDSTEDVSLIPQKREVVSIDDAGGGLSAIGAVSSRGVALRIEVLDISF